MRCVSSEPKTTILWSASTRLQRFLAPRVGPSATQAIQLTWSPWPALLPPGVGGGDPQSTEPGDITGGRGKCHTGKLTQTCHVPFLRLWRTEITAINHYVCGISLHSQRGFCPTRMNYVPHLGFLLESLSEPQG